MPNKLLYNLRMKKVFINLVNLFVFLCFAGIIIFVDCTAIEPNMLITKQKTLYLPNWDKNLDNLKIAVVSDLHIGTKFVNTAKLNSIVYEINSNRPDFIFILGDFDTLKIKELKKEKEITRILKRLKPKYATFAIAGNHDQHNSEIIKRITERAGIIFLENENLITDVKDTKLRITGFQDIWFHNVQPDLILEKTQMPTIALSHNPDLFDKIPNTVSLILSGHTHGGELNLPFVGSPFVPSEFGQRFKKGYVIERNKHIYITGGIATLSRIRFLNPPEIVVLKLKSQRKIPKDTKPKKGFDKNYQLIYSDFFTALRKFL